MRNRCFCGADEHGRVDPAPPDERERLKALHPGPISGPPSKTAPLAPIVPPGGGLRSTLPVEGVRASRPPDLCFQIEADGTILAYYAEDPGDLYLPPEVFLGRRMQALLPSPVGEQFEGALQQIRDSPIPLNIEYSLPMPGGEQFYEAKLTPLLEGTVFVFVRNVTKWRQSEGALRDSEKKFRAIFRSSRDAIGVSAEGIHVLVNPAYLEMFGYGEESELIGRPILEVIAPDRRAEFWENAGRGVESAAGLCAHETRGLRKDGAEFDAEVRVSLFELKGQPHMVIILRDITERKTTEGRLIHTAFHDALTGLPNRTLFTDRLKHAVDRRQRHSDKSFAVFFLDIDRFKRFNDNLGHALGDRLLSAFAARLSESVRSCDSVARIGGDEFAVLLEDLEDRSHVTKILQRLQAALGRPYHLDEHEIYVSASIGVAFSESDGIRPDGLLEAADVAMYEAKRRGPGRYEAFRPEMRKRVIYHLDLETDLRRAVERGEVRAWMQPIVSLGSGRISGFEALARWRHPTRGWIPPDDFIPIAEETGLIVPIGESILRQSCGWARRWQALRGEDDEVTLSVNLSPLQLLRSGFPRHVRQILLDSGFPSCSLRLEVTESAIMQYEKPTLSSLSSLHEMGVRIHLDDFGRGYSSLAYLHCFPIDAVKIHRSFIIAAGSNGEHGQIVRTIIALARDLNMGVIAEGVERADHLDWLRKLGCDWAQGYLFSPAVEPKSVEAMIRRDPRW